MPSSPGLLGDAQRAEFTPFVAPGPRLRRSPQGATVGSPWFLSLAKQRKEPPCRGRIPAPAEGRSACRADTTHPPRFTPNLNAIIALSLFGTTGLMSK